MTGIRKNHIPDIKSPYSGHVIEVSQFDADIIKGLDFKTGEWLAKGNRISGGAVHHGEPRPHGPFIGNVWMIEGDDGLIKVWKSNYDTSN